MLENIKKQNSIPRMRTIHEASIELKRIDPNTAMTEYHIRRLVLDGVPYPQACA